MNEQVMHDKRAIPDRSDYNRQWRTDKRAENPDEYRKKQNDKMNRWRAENPEKARAAHLRSNNSELGVARRKRHDDKYPESRYTRHRKSSLKRRYNMTPEQWDEMFAAQDFACANDGCRTLDPGHKSGWHTDHCHATGKLRAILCRSCNKALGLAKDSPAVLRGLATYLELHGSGPCLPQ